MKKTGITRKALILMLGALVPLLFTQCKKLLKAIEEVEPMTFTLCEKQSDGQNPDGTFAAVDLSLPVPQGEGEAQANVLKGIHTICDASPVAEQLGTPSEDATVPEMVDFYAASFDQAVEEGRTYSMCTYTLGMAEKYQNKVGVVFHVTTGVWGNGGPWEYDTFVRFNDGQELKTSDLLSITTEQVAELAKKNATEEDGSDPMIVEDEYQIMPAANGKACLHVAMGSHFFLEYMIPIEDLKPYLTEVGKEVFEIK